MNPDPKHCFQLISICIWYVLLSAYFNLLAYSRHSELRTIIRPTVGTQRPVLLTSIDSDNCSDPESAPVPDDWKSEINCSPRLKLIVTGSTYVTILCVRIFVIPLPCSALFVILYITPGVGD